MVMGMGVGMEMERILVRQVRTYGLSRRPGSWRRSVQPVFASWQRHQHQHQHQPRRHFHFSRRADLEKPYLLADIGEGITECQIISWSVKPGDKVEEFDPICEVQSDKATVEITSRFDGTITALHYEEGDVAVVGKPLLNMDIPDDVVASAAGVADKLLAGSGPDPEADVGEPQAVPVGHGDLSAPLPAPTPSPSSKPESEAPVVNQNVALTPAVRHMLKEAQIDPRTVRGTGKDGRITKDDVQRHLSASASTSASSHSEVATPTQTPTPTPTPSAVSAPGDQSVRLTATENAMFKVMTQALSIPHFLFTHKVDITSLNSYRKKANSRAILSQIQPATAATPKLTVLPFILKALSHALKAYPKLNSHLHAGSGSGTDVQLVLKGAHNFGIAVDTPAGLLVPVVTNVQDHSIVSLAAEIARLSELARAGRLAPDQFRNATFSVSNIGAIGGDAVAPIIVPPSVGILGVGALQEVPVFGKDEQGNEALLKREQITLSWSADHRIVDGATVAKAAKLMGSLLEDVQSLSLVAR